VDRTSQLSRIAQSPAATDLRGGKASEALSTVRRSNLAAEDAVSFQSDLSFTSHPTAGGSGYVTTPPGVGGDWVARKTSGSRRGPRPRSVSGSLLPHREQELRCELFF
jgi:hypothetical protein